MRRFGISAEDLDRAAELRLTRAIRASTRRRHSAPPFIGSEDWLRLPLTRYPDFSTWQPFLDEIISHPAPDAFRRRHDFRRTIEIPGFHATTWYDIFQTSVIAAFNDIQARAGNQLLWIGPNDHYFIYETNFWPRDPYFEWFDYWLKGTPTRHHGSAGRSSIRRAPGSKTGPATSRTTGAMPNAGRRPGAVPQRFYLCGDGSLSPQTHRPGRSRAQLRLRSAPPDPDARRPQHADRCRAARSAARRRRCPITGLIYRSEPLAEDLTIAGEVRVTLSVQSDCPDTDFVAKLIEVEPRRPRFAADGWRRARDVPRCTVRAPQPSRTRPRSIG